jgi:predicted component of type VI protein secretion system
MEQWTGEVTFGTGHDFRAGLAHMAARLVAVDEGPDILLDRAMVVVGRHPQCDARLDSLRVSRHHCCMTRDHGDVVVRDLGSTNGIRINGQRVEMGRLRSGDELSIAHIRFRLDGGEAHEATLADPLPASAMKDRYGPSLHFEADDLPAFVGGAHPEDALAEKVRGALVAAGVGDNCRIQVIVQVQNEPHDAEDDHECPPDSSH